MSPPIGGRKTPPEFKQYKGTKEEEIETLKLVFRQDGSNPYKDDAYNINGFDRFKPGGKFNETNYHMYRVSLYSDMDVMNCYVAIEDMMRHMISSQHLHVPTRSRYMYSPALLQYLHQVPQVAIEVEEYDFGTRGKRGEETEDNEKWNIVEKERKDRDSRSRARARIKQRLTTTDPPKNYSTFDSDSDIEEEEETEETQDEIVEDKVITDTFEVKDTIEAKVMLLDEEEDVIS
jgi:hypothetical protein